MRAPVPCQPPLTARSRPAQPQGCRQEDEQAAGGSRRSAPGLLPILGEFQHTFRAQIKPTGAGCCLAFALRHPATQLELALGCLGRCPGVSQAETSSWSQQSAAFPQHPPPAVVAPCCIPALTRFDTHLIPQTCCVVYSDPIKTTFPSLNSPTEPLQQLRFDFPRRKKKNKKPSQRHSIFTRRAKSRAEKNPTLRLSSIKRFAV